MLHVLIMYRATNISCDHYNIMYSDVIVAKSLVKQSREDMNLNHEQHKYIFSLAIFYREGNAKKFERKAT